MTIRRNVDINAINRDYSDFREALESLPGSLFLFSRRVLTIVDETIDGLELQASIREVPIDRCDRIREVEALTFDMIRRTNPDGEIDQVIQIGRDLDVRTPTARREYLANLRVPA